MASETFTSSDSPLSPAPVAQSTLAGVAGQQADLSTGERSALTTDTTDARDRVWSEGYRAYYETLYEQFQIEALLKRWGLIDTISGFIVAITASGSTIAGWSLWNQPEYKIAWAILAGIGAVVAIAQRQLNIGTRLKELANCRGRLMEISTEIENIRSRMRVNKDFNAEKVHAEIIKLRSKLTENCYKGTDLLLTDSIKNAAQTQVDQCLSDQIEWL